MNRGISRSSILIIVIFFIFCLSTFAAVNAGFVSQASTPATNSPATTNIPVAKDPEGACYDSSSQNIYVVSTFGTVTVISGTSVVATLTLPSPSVPRYCAYDPSDNEVYVTSSESKGAVYVISGSTLEDTIHGTSLSCSWGATYDTSNSYIYVSNYCDGEVTVISGTTVVGSITINTSSSPDPYGIAYATNNAEVWTADNGDGTLCMVADAANSIPSGCLKVITIFGNPMYVAYDPSNLYIYATDQNPARAYAISSSTYSFTGNMSLSEPPFGIAYDAFNAYMFVSNCCYTGAKTVVEISGVTVLGTLKAQKFPTGLAYDSNSDSIYVANFKSSTVSILS